MLMAFLQFQLRKKNSIIDSLKEQLKNSRQKELEMQGREEELRFCVIF